MKSLMIYFALFIAFIVFPLKASERVTHHIVFGLRVTGIASPGYSGSGFPESTRAIPRHRDDDWISSLYYANNTLPDTTLNIKPRATMYYNVYASWADVLGIGLSLITPGKSKEGRFSQNQYGTSSRGYGTSLRYYEMARSSVSCGLYASLGTPLIKIFKTCCLVVKVRPYLDGVYQLLDSNIRTQSGWDRYDADKKWRKHKVGKIKQHYLNGGLEFDFRDIEDLVGLNILIGYGKTFITHEEIIDYDGPDERTAPMIGGGIKINF